VRNINTGFYNSFIK